MQKGRYYTIKSLGTTTQAAWNTLAGTTGAVYVVGNSFEVKVTGGQPGTGHTSNISGADRLFGPGGSGSQPNNNNAYHSSGPGGTHGHGGAGSHNGHNGSTTYGQHGADGVVIVLSLIHI